MCHDEAIAPFDILILCSFWSFLWLYLSVSLFSISVSFFNYAYTSMWSWVSYAGKRKCVDLNEMVVISTLSPFLQKKTCLDHFFNMHGTRIHCI